MQRNVSLKDKENENNETHSLFYRKLVVSCLMIIAFAVCVNQAYGKVLPNTKLITKKYVYNAKANIVVRPKNTLTAEKYFRIYKIKKHDAVYKRIKGKSFKESGKMPLSNLRYLKVLYVGFDGKSHIGEIIVNQKIANKTKTVFLQLYRAKYQIKSMELIDDYYKKRGEDGNKADWRSMEANNTSAFNYRYITHTRNLSNHSWGRAIDLNPRQNPYSRKVNGIWRAIDHSPKLDKYAQNRSSAIPHVITKKDTAYKAFLKAGFFWGGNWSQTPDYQHFEWR